MIKNICKSGLQTLALPSYQNKSQENISIVVYVGTCLDMNEINNDDDTNKNSINLYYSPSHLIEHTVAIQNDILFNNLQKERNCQLTNATTDAVKTSYYFNMKAKSLTTALPIILDAIYKLKLNKNIFNAEQEVIDHEYYHNKLNNLSDKDLILDIEEYEKAINKVEDKEILEKQQKLEIIKNDLMKQNLSPDFLQNYYNKHYLPENSIIAITNCDQKTYDDFQKVVNNYFDGDKEPVIYDLKKYKKITYGEYTDEIVNEIFESKYTIYELKNRLTDRSKYEFFFKFPNLKNKYSTVSELYEYIFSNPDKISFNENNLINILRRKRHLVYTPQTMINNFCSEDKSVLNLTVNSSCKNTHKIMTGVRAIINKIAFNNGISPKDFKYEKDKFKQYFLTKTYYGNNASAICDFNVLSIFSGQKHADIKNDTKEIDKIRYEDFINFAKYVAKTENYSIVAYGNNIKPSDLKAFELKNKSVYLGRYCFKYTGDINDFQRNRKQFLIAKHLPAEQNQKDTTSNNINNNNKSESVKEN